MRNDYVVHYFVPLCRGRVCAARTVCTAARRAPVVTVHRECVRVWPIALLSAGTCWTNARRWWASSKPSRTMGFSVQTEPLAVMTTHAANLQPENMDVVRIHRCVCPLVVLCDAVVSKSTSKGGGIHTVMLSHCPNKNVFSNSVKWLYDKSSYLWSVGKLFLTRGPDALNALSSELVLVIERQTSN